MDVVVNEELKAYIDPLTEEEYQALERSLLAEGCRDALVMWGNVLVDGHNRYGICRKHDLPFQTVQNTRFQSMDDVRLWMIDQHLGRRSLSDFQRGVLALRKREIVAERGAQRMAAATASPAPADASESVAQAQAPVATEALDNREALARAARLSSGQVAMIEKIHKQATPEVVAAVKAGTISLNAAAAVSSLPAEEQVAAAAAGKDELKLAAKRVRESKRKTASASDGATQDASAAGSNASDIAGNESLQSLRQRVSALTADNDALQRQVKLLQEQLRQARASAADPQDQEQDHDQDAAHPTPW